MAIGYHASHEQFAPSELLDLVRAAEDAGFEGALSSDHFHPWSRRQGQSGFAWSWLGAGMQATALPFGTVCAPGERYHPAVVAQAAATLTEMFRGRFWIAAGSGQLLNEGITGAHWPSKAARNDRLHEAADVIRALWKEASVTRYGLVRVEEATLYTRPAQPPRLLAAAITPETAEWAAAWADGIITVSKPREEMAAVLSGFRRGGGGTKPMYLKAQVSYAPTEDEALRGAWQEWRTNIFDSNVLSGLRLPDDFAAAASHVSPQDVARVVRVSSDLDRHVEWLREDLRMGFRNIYIHNVNRGQRRFIEDFGRHVIPALSGAGGRDA